MRVVPLLLIVAMATPAQGKHAVVEKHDEIDRPFVDGPEGAAVTAEVFCTYFQPQCVSVVANMRELEKRHPKRLRVVYRVLALPARNATYEQLAEVALEAADEARYFEFLQAVWTARYQDRNDPKKLAEKAGLDADRVTAALGDSRWRAQVERDALAAEKLDALGQGIPAIVWNGTVANGNATLEGDQARYEDAWRHAKELLDGGEKPERLYAHVVREAQATSRSKKPSTRMPGVSRKVGADAPEIAPIDADAARATVPIDGAPLLRAPKHEEGSPSVTIVVFADFGCPHCRHLLETLEDVVQAYPDDVQLVFKHAPVDTHREADGAARAAACAQAQGKFWEMSHALWATQNRLTNDEIMKAAATAGVDVDRLAQDLQGTKCAARVAADVADARQLKIYGTTPVAFVNGIQVVGDRPFAEWRAIVEQESAPGMLGRLTDD
jgi:protein-disulfide isomerase